MVSTKAIAAIALTLVVACPIALGYVLSINEEETTAWETTEQYNISDYLLNSSTPYYQIYTGPNNNEVVNAAYVSTGSTVTSNPIYQAVTKSITINGTYQEIPNDARYTIGTSLISVEVRVTEGDGTIYEEIISGSQYGLISKDLNKTVTITKTSAGGGGGGASFAAYLGDDTWQYYNVQKVELKYLVSGTKTLSYSAWTPTGTYADASAGWYPTQNMSWSNGFNNKSVTFSLSFPESANVRMWIPGTEPSTAALAFSYDGTNLYVGHSLGDLTNLGKYSKVRVTISQDEFIVEALKEWASLGSASTVFNSMTLDHTHIESVEAVDIDGITDKMIVFRCDSAEIPAGSFPSTKDCTLNLVDLFPDSLMSMKLNSIGVYGDNLSIGGASYPVTNGRILVDGKAVNLKGAMISFIPEDGWLSCYINGRDTGMHFADLPEVTFEGEWSLTAIAYKVEEVSSSSMEWSPGGFGLSRDGFIAAGLLTACAVFVLLGMYGKASGTKVGLLAVICGGAAIVYIMLI